MAKKNSQMDLEEAIQVATLRQKAEKGKAYETVDVFTGEIFQSPTPNHYEPVDPKPFAPAVDLPRPTLRQRVENLLNRTDGANLMARYVHDGTDDRDYDIPDDSDTPLTPSERNYLDMVAADLAENAPLPDDDMPRQQSPLVKPQKPGVEEGAGDEGGGTQAAPPEDPSPRKNPKKPAS